MGILENFSHFSHYLNMFIGCLKTSVDPDQLASNKVEYTILIIAQLVCLV